jgi:regulator of protease activity HflC (stomatin/prohibitin superfamily)
VLIRRERVGLNKRIADFCQTKINGRYGVKFCAVDMTKILPPDEIAEALNAVINAQIGAEELFARAEGECQQRILSARKGVSISCSLAKAAEIEIATLSKFLSELQKQGTLQDYIKRRRVEVYSEARAVFRKEIS